MIIISVESKTEETIVQYTHHDSLNAKNVYKCEFHSLFHYSRYIPMRPDNGGKCGERNNIWNEITKLKNMELLGFVWCNAQVESWLPYDFRLRLK